MENKKLNILMLNYEFPPLGGGGGIASYKLAKGFVKLGRNVDVVTTWFKGLKEFEIKEGINIYRVKVPGRNKLQTASLISMIFFPRKAYKICKDLIEKNKYDFINTQFAIPTGPLGIRLSEEFNIKNILSLHGGDIHDPTKKLSPHNNFILKRIVKRVLNNSDIIVAQSSNTKENAIKYYHPNKEIKVIPLPYEEYKFKKVSRDMLGLKKDRRYVIGVGRLVKRKGFDTAIKALSKIPDERVELLIIGDGPEKNYLLNLSKELDIENRVHFLGQVSEEKKFQYLSNSDIYLLSSIHEGFGIVLQEAMQVGLPIVATNNGGQIDLIKDGKNGFLVNVGDVSFMANKIQYLLRNRNIRNSFRKENKKIIDKFKLENIAERYLGVLR